MPGTSSGLARRYRSGRRNDLPDQGTSAETSTTTGSTRVSRMGSLRSVNRSRVVGEISAGQGCPARGCCRCMARAFEANLPSGDVEPTIQSRPNKGRPATTADGESRRPTTAAHTTSRELLRFTLSHCLTPSSYLWAAPLLFPVEFSVLKLCEQARPQTAPPSWAPSAHTVKVSGHDRSAPAGNRRRGQSRNCGVSS